MTKTISKWVPMGLPSLHAGLAMAAFVLLLAGFFGINEHRQTRDRLDADLRSVAFFLSDHAARLFEVSDLALQRAGTATANASWDGIEHSTTVWEELREIRSAIPYIEDLWLNDTTGRLRMTTHSFPNPGSMAADRDFFRAQVHEDAGLFVGETLIGRVTKRPTFVMSRRLQAADGSFRGIVAATASTSYLGDYWSKLQLPKGARVSLFRAVDGKVIAQHPSPAPGQPFVDAMSKDLMPLIGAGSGAGSFDHPAPDDTRLGAYHQVGSLPIYIRVTVPHSVVNTAWMARIRPYALVALLALVTLPVLTGLGLRHARQERLHSVRLEHEVIRRKKDLATLNRTGQTLSESTGAEPIIQAVTDAAVVLSGARYGAFVSCAGGEGGEEISLYTPAGSTREDFPQFPVARDVQVFAPILSSREAIRLDDVAKDPRYAGTSLGVGAPGGPAMRSLLSVPVISHSGEIHGALVFGHEDSGVFGPDEEEVIRGLASQTAIALDNARLYASAQKEIEARRQTEAQQKLLIRELHHRVKNTLATVQAVMGATARSSSSIEEFQEAFTARVSSLAQTHTLLTEALWQTAPLHELVAKELSPYGEERISIRGPAVELASEMAVPLGMAVHELATNAAKYGALSVPGGHLDVEWHVRETQDGPMLDFSWRESKGPLVIPPTRIGFGSRLIDRVLKLQLKATVKPEYRPEGFRLGLTSPLLPSQQGLRADAA